MAESIDPTREVAKWRVLTPPAAYPVSFDDVLYHLRIDGADNGVVQTYIEAATDYVEERLSASLMERTLIATFYDGEKLDLPRGPLLAVSGIIDRGGNVVSAFEIANIGHTARVVLKSSASYPVSVTYRAGYAPFVEHPTNQRAAVPASLRLAVLMLAGTYYENRESVGDKAKLPVPHSFDEFLGLKARHVGVG